jgi:hypothetical protein
MSPPIGAFIVRLHYNDERQAWNSTGEVRLRNWRCYGVTAFAYIHERRLVAGARNPLNLEFCWTAA